MTTAAPANIKPLPRNTVVPVAGISKYQAAANRTHIGDEVVLRHELSNTFDADAVVITTLTGDVLGYVPAASRQNSRLLVGHRGGVWGGVVVDKFEGGETVGLRVKIITLLGHRPAAFGSDHPGLRARCEEPPIDGLDEPRPPDAATGQPTVVVRARSGRYLGVLVETVGNRVRVRGTDDRVTAFPAAVVTLEETTDVLPAGVHAEQLPA